MFGKSRHSLEVRRRYADASIDSQGRLLGNGWMVKSESGQYHALIDEWLNKGALPAEKPETERERNLSTS